MNEEPGHPARVHIYQYAKFLKTLEGTHLDFNRQVQVQKSVSIIADLLLLKAPVIYSDIDIKCIEQAILHHTSHIVLAIAEELLQYKIIRMPGDVFYPDMYYLSLQTDELSLGYDLLRNGYVRIARGKICSNCIYELSTSSFFMKPYTFDLNREEDLTKLIDTIKETYKCTEAEHQ